MTEGSPLALSPSGSTPGPSLSLTSEGVTLEVGASSPVSGTCSVEDEDGAVVTEFTTLSAVRADLTESLLESTTEVKGLPEGTDVEDEAAGVGVPIFASDIVGQAELNVGVRMND